ncbi:(R,S)-reticuline 7-O-methyltransferase-like [Lycium ferocissimum]|uniref:(R,S)-reticuline 7-O-methyltransferase-like n=1 Tax=Lycium ferocissimum TaxID=112874 RepID=UPI002816393B|nr:(R,S)-reticuline 7-O-methyltransferase-like [Lycium ferocissimum]
MGDIDSMNEAAMLQGQAQLSKYISAFPISMAIKCAVELRIADIIHSHGHPITMSPIATNIDSSSPDISYLSRIMRLLVRQKIFTAATSQGEDTFYGLNPISRLLLHDTELSLAPMFLFQNNPILMAPWHCFSSCVKEGGIAFKKAHGSEIFDMASKDEELNESFNNGMNSVTKSIMKSIITGYKDGFNSITSLVDVGGGTGAAMSEIVKAYPHIKGTNFDLPHVVSTAQKYEGVSHVRGDMFQAIPPADAVFVKRIMHDWGDEDCVKILKNCRKAISEKTGKVIIVEAVLKPEGEGLFDDLGFMYDLVMIAHSSGGKERSEDEWNKLLKAGGFPRYNIIEIPSWLSIIEAYPQ